MMASPLLAYEIGVARRGWGARRRKRGWGGEGGGSGTAETYL